MQAAELAQLMGAARRWKGHQTKNKESQTTDLVISAMKLWEEKCDEKHEKRFFLTNLNPLTEDMGKKKIIMNWSRLVCPVHSKIYGCLSKQNVINLGYQIVHHGKMLSGTELGPMIEKERCYTGEQYIDGITTVLWKQRKRATSQNLI